MGFDINPEITTVLTYKDVALIVVALGAYQKTCDGPRDTDRLEHARDLTNRLGRELYDVKTPKQENLDV